MTEWMEDLDEEAIDKSARYDVKPRAGLPNVFCVLCGYRPAVGTEQQLEKDMVRHEHEHPEASAEALWEGEEKQLILLSEPRKITAEKLPTGEAFVMSVDDGTGIEKDMIAPKTIRFELAKLLKQGKNPFDRRVVIGAKPLYKYKTKDGREVKRGKTYFISLLRAKEEKEKEKEEVEL